MRIAVYAGSFNPLHIGHLAIMECLNELYDCVYLVVSPCSPFKDTDTSTGRTRYKQALKAVARHPELKVEVKDIELNMEPPYYTIRTLDALTAREPGNIFTLVVGADQLALLRLWHDWQRILREYGVAVYPRSGYDCEALRQAFVAESNEYRLTLLDAPLVDVSSTEIRKRENTGEDMSGWRM